MKWNRFLTWQWKVRNAADIVVVLNCWRMWQSTSESSWRRIENQSCWGCDGFEKWWPRRRQLSCGPEKRLMSIGYSIMVYVANWGFITGTSIVKLISFCKNILLLLCLNKLYDFHILDVRGIFAKEGLEKVIPASILVMNSRQNARA